MPHSASTPNFMATNSAPKTDDSIVGCFYESQVISNMFKKIRNPVRNCCVILSSAWLLSTIMHRSTSFPRGGRAFVGIAFWTSP
jgi:hypothetical protein